MGYAYTTTFILYWNPYQNFYIKIRDRDNGRRRVEEGHERLMVKAILLYADARMVESTDLVWLQSAFD